MSSNQTTKAPVDAATQPEDKGPCLPTDIIVHMIDLLSDDYMPYVWCIFRQVCKEWKAETERVFWKKYLHKTTINLYIPFLSGTEYSSVFKFDRLSEEDDGASAIFKLLPSPDGRSPMFPVRIADDNPSLYNPFEGMFHIVSIENMACNDSYLEGLRYDTTKEELSVPWTPLISRLLGEELLIRRRAQEICDSGLPPIDGSEDNAQHPFGFGSGWNSQTMDKTMLIYLLYRTRQFRKMMADIRESRVRREYARDGLQFESMEAHDIVHDMITPRSKGTHQNLSNGKDLRISSMRNSFRTKDMVKTL